MQLLERALQGIRKHLEMPHDTSRRRFMGTAALSFLFTASALRGVCFAEEMDEDFALFSRTRAQLDSSYDDLEAAYSLVSELERRVGLGRAREISYDKLASMRPNILLLGNNHTDKYSYLFFSELLKSYNLTGERVSLFLELVGEPQAKIMNDYVKGERPDLNGFLMDRSNFLAHYAALAERLKKLPAVQELEIYGDPVRNYNTVIWHEVPDQYSSQKAFAEYIAQTGDDLKVAIVGAAHCVKPDLPSMLSAKGKNVLAVVAPCSDDLALIESVRQWYRHFEMSETPENIDVLKDIIGKNPDVFDAYVFANTVYRQPSSEKLFTF